jgi:hypothetical protein
MFGSLFSPRQQQQAPQQQQQQQPTPGSSMQPAGNQPQQQAPQGGEQGTGKPAASPLDTWKDLWKTPDTQGQQPADPFSQPLFNMDSAKLQEAVTKTDFTQGVPPELMQKVMQGGDPQALISLINHVGQQSLSLSMQLNQASLEQAGKTIGKRVNDTLPGKFNEFQLNNTAPTNPVLQDPAVAPMLKMARSQVRMMHPDKSAAEINALAEQYISDFANVVAGGKGPNTNDGGGQKGEMDWADWGGLTPSR